MNIFSFLQSGISAFVPFIVLLGILIFVHELGHFLVARWCGVRVEVFSLGFGKKILKYKRGDTTYAISLIPLGGYVKMYGEQPGTDIPEEDKRVSFTHKNVWQRIAIVLAGPLMNFVFAILIFFIVAITGEEAKTPVMGDVEINSPAYQAGFRSGDRLLTINGQPVATWNDFQGRLQLKESSPLRLEFEVERENSQEIAKFDANFNPVPNPNLVSRYDYQADLPGISPFSLGTAVGVLPHSILKSLGLKPGDWITAVNGQTIQYGRHLTETLQQQNTNEELVLQIKSDDGEKTLTLAPKSVKDFSFASLGLENSELYLSLVVSGSPADKAGLKPQDRLVAINGVTLDKWSDVIENIKSFDGENPVKLLVRRDTQELELSILPKMTSQMLPTGVEDKRYTIGISPVINIATPEMLTVKAESLGAGLVRGVEKTWDMTVMTVMSFVRLFQAKISPKNLGGVISIGQAASETFKIGITQFLQMMAIISVNLFILNLLPIPVLDGGHLVFYVIEAIKGAPVSLRKMQIAQQVGMALLMSLMIFALFNDFSRILKL